MEEFTGTIDRIGGVQDKRNQRHDKKEVAYFNGDRFRYKHRLDAHEDAVQS